MGFDLGGGGGIWSYIAVIDAVNCIWKNVNKQIVKKNKKRAPAINAHGI